ncbi:hypothetical protein ACFY7H_33740 [Streptomyces sp. NPDC012794]|uniref:hypothetical protein n=1 Tax=Streptomyces sp. NPDC012794 TaxID=3364850 RepID=UPI0036CE8FE8
MALFRKTISQSDLSSGLSDADREKHRTDYSAADGGWVRKAEPRTTTEAGTSDTDSSGARKWWR